jgi:hypothetical protein
MTNLIDPRLFGLPPKTIVREIDKDTLAIVIDRKSRIIMADGRKILAKAAKIQEAKPGCRVVLKTTAPVCSKTLQYLAENGVQMQEI